LLLKKEGGSFLRVMGLDIGTKRVGVALSDPSAIIALAKDTFEYSGEEELIENIKQRIKQFEAMQVVVGLPLNMNGSVGRAAKKILQIVEILKKELSIPVYVFDERLSTVMAEGLLKDLNLSSKKRKKMTDAASAQIILQDYLVRTKVINEK
jgi:putative Holliday junction resolvase